MCKFLVLAELHFLMYKIGIIPTWKNYCLWHRVSAKCMLIVVIVIFYYYHYKVVHMEWEQEDTTPSLGAQGSLQEGWDARNPSCEESDRITRNDLNKVWCVGPETSNKFIWIGVTETSVQRIQFLKDGALQGFVLSKPVLRYETSSSHLSKGFTVNTSAVIHLFAKCQGTQEAHFPSYQWPWLTTCTFLNQRML